MWSRTLSQGSGNVEWEKMWSRTLSQGLGTTLFGGWVGGCLKVVPFRPSSQLQMWSRGGMKKKRGGESSSSSMG